MAAPLSKIVFFADDHATHRFNRRGDFPLIKTQQNHHNADGFFYPNAEDCPLQHLSHLNLSSPILNLSLFILFTLIEFLPCDWLIPIIFHLLF